MKGIKRIPLSRLFKIEVSLLLESVVETLAKHNPEALRLQELSDLLTQQMKKAKVLKKQYGKHPLTSELKQLHKKRLNYATIVNMQLESMARKHCEETKYMVAQAQRLSTMFLTYLGQKKQAVAEFQIHLFFTQLYSDDNAESLKAFVGLGLQPYLDEIQVANIQHRKIFNQRSRDIEGRAQTRDRVLERETERLMQLFFDQVNYFQKIYTEIDYSSFITELNVILTEYSKLLETRVATNKRKAIKRALARNDVLEKETNKETKPGSKSKESDKLEIKSKTKPVAESDAKPTNIIPGANKDDSGEDTPKEDLKKGPKPPTNDEEKK